MEKMEENNIPKLIQKMGGFDTMNVDSKFNLDQMVQMQNDAAERNVATRMEEFLDWSGRTLENWKSSTSLCRTCDRTSSMIRMII